MAASTRVEAAIPQVQSIAVNLFAPKGSVGALPGLRYVHFSGKNVVAPSGVVDYNEPAGGGVRDSPSHPFGTSCLDERRAVDERRRPGQFRAETVEFWTQAARAWLRALAPFGSIQPGDAEGNGAEAPDANLKVLSVSDDADVDAFDAAVAEGGDDTAPLPSADSDPRRRVWREEGDRTCCWASGPSPLCPLWPWPVPLCPPLAVGVGVWKPALLSLSSVLLAAVFLTVTISLPRPPCHGVSRHGVGERLEGIVPVTIHRHGTPKLGALRVEAAEVVGGVVVAALGAAIQRSDALWGSSGKVSDLRGSAKGGASQSG